MERKKEEKEKVGGEGKHALPRLRKYPSRASINIPFFPSIRSLTKADERMGKKKKKEKNSRFSYLANLRTHLGFSISIKVV